ncbi:MAG: flagellar biosynthesis anti-sigma factor FlgM [Clostridia bacterium]|nr:flagellar biosynthesis anti-sigma factor FlgM [Clostridia bacterium]
MSWKDEKKIESEEEIEVKISGILSSYFVQAYKSSYNNVSEKRNAAGDTVEISSDAMELLAESEDLRTEKIEDIKQRIASGSYAVNSTDIVDKMIASLR